MTDAVVLDKSALARMRERTRQSREHMASVMFKWESVESALSLAAAKGQSSIIIRPEPEMDVSETETAKAFVALLQEAGFVAEWEKKRPVDGEPWTQLRISWGADAKG